MQMFKLLLDIGVWMVEVFYINVSGYLVEQVGNGLFFLDVEDLVEWFDVVFNQVVGVVYLFIVGDFVFVGFEVLIVVQQLVCIVFYIF